MRAAQQNQRNRVINCGAVNPRLKGEAFRPLLKERNGAGGGAPGLIPNEDMPGAAQGQEITAHFPSASAPVMSMSGRHIDCLARARISNFGIVEGDALSMKRSKLQNFICYGRGFTAFMRSHAESPFSKQWSSPFCRKYSSLASFCDSLALRLPFGALFKRVSRKRSLIFLPNCYELSEAS